MLVDAWDEVRETMQQAGAMDAGVGGQTAIAHQRAQARFPRADQPRVRGAHAVTVTSETIGLHFGPRHEVIDSAPHIQNIFPSHALTGDRVAQEFESFIGTAAEFLARILPLLKTQGVWAQHHVAELGQCHAGVVHGIACKTRWLRLAQMPLASVLMPDGHGRRGRCVAHAIGYQQDRWAPIAWLQLVSKPFQTVTILLLRLGFLGLQISAFRPRSAEAFEQFVAEEFLFRIHGRLGSGGIPRRQRRGACSEGSGLDEITAVGHEVEISGILIPSCS